MFNALPANFPLVRIGCGYKQEGDQHKEIRMVANEKLFCDVPVPITEKQIRCLMCGAFEGGSNYWVSKIKFQLAPDVTLADFKAGGKYALFDVIQEPTCYLVPFIPGCSLSILVEDEDEGDKWYTLDREAMVRGIQLLATKAPRHFADLVRENDDAETADVWLQLALFGETIYG